MMCLLFLKLTKHPNKLTPSINQGEPFLDEAKNLCQLLGELTLAHLKVHLAADDGSKAAPVQLFDKLHKEAKKPKFMNDICQLTKRKPFSKKTKKKCSSPKDFKGIDIMMEVSRPSEDDEFGCEGYPARATYSFPKKNTKVETYRPKVETVEYVTKEFRDVEVAYLWSPSEYKREVDDVQDGEYIPNKGVMKITPILDKNFDMDNLWWFKNARSFFLKRDEMYFEAEGILDVANTTIDWTVNNSGVVHNFIWQSENGWEEEPGDGIDQGHKSEGRESPPPAKKSSTAKKSSQGVKKRKPEKDQKTSTAKPKKNQKLDSNTTEDCLSATQNLLQLTVTQLSDQVKRLESTVKELQDTAEGLKTQIDKIQLADV